MGEWILIMQRSTGTISSLGKFRNHRLTKLFAWLIPIVIIVIAAIVAPILTGSSITPRSPRDRFTPPLSRTSDGTIAWFGTDQLGRDMLLEVIHGGKTSLFVSFVSVGIAMIIGTALGIIAGYNGGWLDLVIMRIAEIQLCFPSTLLAIFLAVFISGGLTGVIVVLTAIRWAQFARVARGETLHLKHREFVEAARSLGANTFYIVCRHIVPHLVSTLTVLATSMLGRQMIIEASLSFLGIGVTRPAVSWGGIIASGRGYITQAWWVSTLPGIIMLVTVLSISLFGDALRDYLDPKV